MVKFATAFIYALYNVVSCKNYVGSTVKEPEVRFYEHKRNLKLQRHLNKYLQNAWNKNGEGAFVLKVLEECSAKLRYKREQWWITHLKASDPKYGYNIIHPVRSLMPAIRRSEISKEIWSRPGLKEQVAKASSKRWNDPVYKAHMTAVSLETWKKAGRKEQHQVTMQKRWSNPKQHKELSKRNKKRWSDIEKRKKHGAMIKALWKTEEYKKKQAKAGLILPILALKHKYARSS